MAKKKTPTLAFKERLQSRKLWLSIIVLVIGIIFHLKGTLDKEMVSLLAMIYLVYAAGNIGAKYTFMKYG